jgi:hypothetical protein
VFSDPKTGVLYVYYGQERYTTLLNALQYLPTDPFTEGDTFDFTTFLGYLVLRGNASDLTDINNNSIINGGLFRGSGQGSGGGIAISNLDDLTDVSITGPIDGEALVYNAGIWGNGTPTSSSYSVTSSLALNAVTASFAQTASLAPNYVLTSVTSSMLAPYVLTSQTSSMSVASASVATSASYALTASFALNGGGTINTGSLLITASVSLNTITFTKGDGSTFPITVNTGSGGGGGSSFPFTGSAIISGSLEVIGSTNLNGTLNLDTNPSTASLGPGLTTNLLSISSSQVNFDFDELEGDFDLVQTGSQSVTGAVTASYFKGDGTEISGISAINWFLS